jgi:mono/diheme cytochrome c family protein
MNPAKFAIALVMILTAGAAPASAQSTGDVARGAALARQWCASCHIVAQGEGRSASDAVPTFMAIAAMPSTTATSLRVFLQTPHLRMPNFALSVGETDDAIAYILSLRR